ncbi:hypothetical protein BZA77DRAFT_348851 [Pyronema omphalodes]|nr:hypothetical protein BZA77DRAFT_348851 [Pyronema omphalodes]
METSPSSSVGRRRSLRTLRTSSDHLADCGHDMIHIDPSTDRDLKCDICWQNRETLIMRLLEPFERALRGVGPTGEIDPAEIERLEREDQERERMAEERRKSIEEARRKKEEESKRKRDRMRAMQEERRGKGGKFEKKKPKVELGEPDEKRSKVPQKGPDGKFLKKGTVTPVAVASPSSSKMDLDISLDDAPSTTPETSGTPESRQAGNGTEGSADGGVQAEGIQPTLNQVEQVKLESMEADTDKQRRIFSEIPIAEISSRPSRPEQLVILNSSPVKRAKIPVSEELSDQPGNVSDGMRPEDLTELKEFDVVTLAAPESIPSRHRSISTSSARSLPATKLSPVQKGLKQKTHIRRTSNASSQPSSPIQMRFVPVEAPSSFTFGITIPPGSNAQLPKHAEKPPPKPSADKQQRTISSFFRPTSLPSSNSCGTDSQSITQSSIGSHPLLKSAAPASTVPGEKLEREGELQRKLKEKERDRIKKFKQDESSGRRKSSRTTAVKEVNYAESSDDEE